MTLKEYVQKQTNPDEKLIVLSNWSVMRLMSDGSAILYKNPRGTIETIGLSRHDIEFIKGMALPVRIFTPDPESEKDVHTEHCCEIHGCKYGHDNCPVVNWRKSNHMLASPVRKMPKDLSTAETNLPAWYLMNIRTVDFQ